MKRTIIFSLLPFLLVACSSRPLPPSWEKDLHGVPKEEVNKNIDMANIHQVLNKTLAWSTKDD